jgi:hypothetical protein
LTDKPWFRFYPVDWRGDAKLKVCSLAARGLWVDLLAIMHEGTPRGHLTIAGSAPSEADLARLLGVPVGHVRRALVELEQRGVALRTEGGVVFSKRMVRDTEKGEADKANGQRGGNPQVKPPVKPPVNPGVNPPVKAAGGPARAHPGNRNGNDSGVEALSGVEPEKGAALTLVPPTALELSPGQLQAAVPGLVGAWNNIAACSPPFVEATFRSHPKAMAALRTHPSIDWWGDLFRRVVASDFLAGRQPMRDGRVFVADLLWVLDHADEIALGRHDNRTALSGNEAVLARVLRDLA